MFAGGRPPRRVEVAARAARRRTSRVMGTPVGQRVSQPVQVAQAASASPERASISSLFEKSRKAAWSPRSRTAGMAARRAQPDSHRPQEMQALAASAAARSSAAVGASPSAA